MGCSCLKSNTVIKSKVIPIENSISNQIPENIILPQQQHISNNNIIPSNNSNNNQCTNNNQNEIFNLQVYKQIIEQSKLFTCKFCSHTFDYNFMKKHFLQCNPLSNRSFVKKIRRQ